MASSLRYQKICLAVIRIAKDRRREIKMKKNNQPKYQKKSDVISVSWSQQTASPLCHPHEETDGVCHSGKILALPLPVCPPHCLLSSLPAVLPTFLPVSLNPSLPACLPPSLYACLPASWRAYLYPSLPASLSPYLPNLILDFQT